MFAYSHSLKTKAQVVAYEKALVVARVTDRSGASSTQQTMELKAKLYDIHQNHYRSADINWFAWAVAIEAAEPHLRERMLNEPPPSTIIHLFTSTNDNVGVTLQHARQANVVAVNELERERELLLNLIASNDRALASNAETQRRLAAALMREFGSTLRPIENGVSRFLYGQVDNALGYDHA